jgi:hypothetical protein
MLKFWIAFTLIFIFTTISAVINKSLYARIIFLIPWIKNEYNPTLVKGGRGDEAATITRKMIPQFEEWAMASLWYSLITFSLQIVLLLSGAYVSYYKNIPYLIALINTMLLGSTVMFFFRTFKRNYAVGVLHSTYQKTYFETQIEIQKQKSAENPLDPK